MYIDLGIEGLLSADKEGLQIAVEVKGFNSPSPLADLEQAVGQFTIYAAVIKAIDLPHRLYLAVSNETFGGIFSEPLGQLMLTTGTLQLVIVDEIREEIVQWIPKL